MGFERKGMTIMKSKNIDYYLLIYVYLYIWIGRGDTIGGKITIDEVVEGIWPGYM